MRSIAVRAGLLFRRYFQPAGVNVAGFVEDAQLDGDRYANIAAEEVNIRAPVGERIAAGIEDRVEVVPAHLDAVNATVVRSVLVDGLSVNAGAYVRQYACVAVVAAADGDDQFVITDSRRLDQVLDRERAVFYYLVATVVFHRVAEVVVALRNAGHQAVCALGDHGVGPYNYRINTGAGHLAILVGHFYFYFGNDLSGVRPAGAVVRYVVIIQYRYAEATGTAPRAGGEGQALVGNAVPVRIFARAGYLRCGEVAYFDDLVPVQEAGAGVQRVTPVEDIPGTGELVCAVANIDFRAVGVVGADAAVAVLQVVDTSDREDRRVAGSRRSRVAVGVQREVLVTLQGSSERRHLDVVDIRQAQGDLLSAGRNVAFVVNGRESTGDNDGNTVAVGAIGIDEAYVNVVVAVVGYNRVARNAQARRVVVDQVEIAAEQFNGERALLGREADELFNRSLFPGNRVNINIDVPLAEPAAVVAEDYPLVVAGVVGVKGRGQDVVRLVRAQRKADAHNRVENTAHRALVQQAEEQPLDEQEVVIHLRDDVLAGVGRVEAALVHGYKAIRVESVVQVEGIVIFFANLEFSQLVVVRAGLSAGGIDEAGVVGEVQLVVTSVQRAAQYVSFAGNRTNVGVIRALQVRSGLVLAGHITPAVFPVEEREGRPVAIIAKLQLEVGNFNKRVVT